MRYGVLMPNGYLHIGIMQMALLEVMPGGYFVLHDS